MKRTKTIWLAALALVMVMLSACGSNNNGGNATNEPAASNSGATAAPETAKPVTLTMMMSGNKAADGQDFELDVLPKLVKEKFPNITLEVQKLPDDQYNEAGSGQRA
jgi:raffinose/stachyose/melibiose transport system substrate-binding protein